MTDAFDADLILDHIRRWVEIESPTHDGAAVNRMVDCIAADYAALPVDVERIAGRDGLGDHLIARSRWGQDRPGILILSHSDTVHPIGFLKRLPFRREGDVVFGPGIYDMKGGMCLALHAFAAVAKSGGAPLGVTHMIVSDEEIGSPTSRALIEQEGRKAKYVLVTEPARDGGKIVTARKGVGRFEVFIKGVPSHAGTKPEDGRSAIRELGHVILALDALNDPARGISINTGVVRGGSVVNVVAEEAYAEVDLRASTVADADDLCAKILALKPVTPDVTLTVTGGMNRPPYELTPAGKALFEHTRRIAAEIGIADLEGVFTGGGSDGNFTAPYAATLDGLGIDGKGAHTHYEQALFSSIAPRTLLLKRLIETL